MVVEFISIPLHGELPNRKVHPFAKDVCHHTAINYQKTGYEPPWTGYLCFSEGDNIGTCAFKAPAKDNKVEIAYFVFPEYEGMGNGTFLAAQLVKIARDNMVAGSIYAQTLPTLNASTRILEKLNFKRVRSVHHPEDGEVWEWLLNWHPS